MKPRVGLSVLALVLSACARSADAPFNEAAVGDSIRAAMSGYVNALRNNDPASVSGFWTPDAVYMNAGSPTVVGRAGFDSMVRGTFATGRLTEVTANTDEILIDRATAVHRGTYSETFQPQRGPIVHLRGRYMIVWRRQPDGIWKIARGVEMPLPAAPGPR